MPFVPPALKSPVVLALALVLLAMMMWGSWMFLRRSGKDHQLSHTPATLTDEPADDNPVRDAARI